MPFVDALKRRLHRDIVADPVLHARVLNLYLSGEAYPHRVDDYFPHAHVEDAQLAARMRSHAQEEDKHVALYARAIRKLGQQVQDLPLSCIFNAVIRGHTPASWAIRPEQSRDARRLALAHFMAHAHCLEKRIARSLEFHYDACAHAVSPYPGKAVGAVLSDEHSHVAYTREAVGNLLPKQAAAEVWAVHERAERRANLDFSASQLGRLLRDPELRWPRSRKVLYRTSALALRGLLSYA